MHSNAKKLSDNKYSYMMKCCKCDMVNQVNIEFEDYRRGGEIAYRDVMIKQRNGNVKIYDGDLLEKILAEYEKVEKESKSKEG